MENNGILDLLADFLIGEEVLVSKPLFSFSDHGERPSWKTMASWICLLTSSLVKRS